MTIKYLDAKRIRGSSAQAKTTTYETDFTTSTSWVQGDTDDIEITNNQVEFAARQVAGMKHVYYDLGSSVVSGTAWVLRAKVVISTLTASGGIGTNWFIGLRSATSGTGDYVGIRYRTQASPNNNAWFKTAVDESEFLTGGGTQTAIVTPTTRTYYMEMKRLDADDVTLTLYNNSDYTGVYQATVTNTNASAMGDLRYLDITINGYSGGAWASQIAGTVDDIKFYNGITDASDVDEKATLINSPDYDGSGTWATTGSQVTESSGVISFDIETRLANHTVTKDLSTALSNAAWVMRCKLDFTTLNEVGDSTTILEVGMSSDSSSTAMSTSAGGDYIGLQLRVLTGGSGHGWGLQNYNDEATEFAEDPAFDTYANTSTTYYVEIKRLSTTSMSIGLYTDSDYDTLISGLPLETKTGMSSSIQGLQYIRIGNSTHSSQSNTQTIEGTLQDIQIWNAVTTAVPATTIPENTIFEETDTRSTLFLKNNVWRKATYGFNVSGISALYSWYDSDDETTITKSSNRVSKWENKEGTTERDLIQSTSGNQPLWEAVGMNGRGSIDFDDDRYMESASDLSAISQPYTVFSVQEFLTFGSGSGQQDGLAIDGRSSSNRLNHSNHYSANNVMLNAGGNLANDGNATDNENHLTVSVCNGASSDNRVDGIASTGNAGSNAWAGIEVGANSSESVFWNARIVEIIVYHKVVSGSELTDVETYLKNKWGIE